MLKIKDMNSNNVIRQGDTQPREYQLDTGNLNLNLTNKSATIRLMTADFQGIGYETTATVSSENKISFSIDDVIPARQYRLEVTVDDYVFPSRATDGRFDIDPSSHGQEVNIINVIGKDEIVRDVKARVENELEPFLGEIEQAETTRQSTFESNENSRQTAFEQAETNREEAELKRAQAELARQEAEGEREEIYEKVKDLPETFQNVIDETTGKDFISAPEIIDARRGKASLGEKIDEVTTQLAQKATKGEIGLTDVNKNIFLLDETYFTDATKQQWAGTTPVNATPADGGVTTKKIAEKAVDNSKVSFLKQSRNLFNPYDVNLEIGKKIRADGALETNATYNTTGYISVTSGNKIQVSRASGTSLLIRAYALYDDNKKLVTPFESAGAYHTGFIIPEGIAYIRITYGADSQNLQIEIGETITNFVHHLGYLKDVELETLRLGTVLPEHTSFLTIKPSGKNLFNPDDEDIAIGKIINADGTLSNNTNYNTTGYIDVSQMKKVYVSRSSGSFGNVGITRAYALYDSGKNLLSAVSTGAAIPSPILIPKEKAYFLRVSYAFDNANYQIEENGISTYEPFATGYGLDGSVLSVPKFNYQQFANYWDGKKIVVNGDSIPQGYTTAEMGPLTAYPVLVADDLGMVLNNYAIGGSTIAINKSNPTDKTPLVSRYQEMSDDTDLVMIAAGTNDWSHSWTPVGDMDSRSNNDFYGALHNLCLGLIEKYSGKQLLFLTPIKRQTDPNLVNSLGKKLEDYVNIIKEVCGFYGIPVLDMFNECTINPSIPSQLTAYIPDGTHPNKAGHEIMAKRVIGYLRQLQ